MKAIKLHGSAPDSAGDFHPAGKVLTIGDGIRAGFIALDRAERLVKTFAASPVGAAPAKPASKAKARKKAAKAKPAS